MNQDEPLDINERAVSRRVQESLTEMHVVRQEFLRALQVGRLTDKLTLKFQSRILDVIEELRPYRGRASDMWENATEFEHGLDKLPYKMNAVEVKKTVETGFGREKVAKIEEPATLRPHHLRIISEDLDEIAREIGFEPAPEQNPGDVEGGVI